MVPSVFVCAGGYLGCLFKLVPFDMCGGVWGPSMLAKVHVGFVRS